jgi:hypothetical protein
MDTTASSFTLRKNAKRAAEAMIRKGIAPAVDYEIKLSDAVALPTEAASPPTPAATESATPDANWSAEASAISVSTSSWSARTW